MTMMTVFCVPRIEFGGFRLSALQRALQTGQFTESLIWLQPGQVLTSG